MDTALLIKNYKELTDAQVIERIREHKARLGDQVLLLVHNYQRREIVELADRVGDSLELAKIGRDHTATPNIVLCGVHFMAETARILAGEHQHVYLPNKRAGCPMADMGEIDKAEQGWAEASEHVRRKLVPITYVNSHAEMKAFTGRHGGLTSTSSNAREIFKHYLDRDYTIFFFPDEHLGRNMANLHGIGRDVALEWDRQEPYGGNEPRDLAEARVLLWKGYCHVHTHFTVQHIEKARQEFPGCKVIVHPECTEETVAAADASGSTRYIADYVHAASPGDAIVIGTEINHVRNLAIDYPDRTVVELSRSLCPNMYKINLRNLLFTLEHMEEVDEIVVPADIAQEGRLAVERMLELS